MRLTERTMPGYGDPATWGGASLEPDTGFNDWLDARLPTVLANHADLTHEAAWESLSYECLRFCLVLAYSPEFRPVALQQFGREVANTPAEVLAVEIEAGGIDTLDAIDMAVSGNRETWPRHIQAAADTLRDEVLKVASSWYWLRDLYDTECREAAMRARCGCCRHVEGCQC